MHDTDKDGIKPFNANSSPRRRGATPLKRPENGMFRPGSNFTEFVFTETGDTNAKTEAGAELGGFGAVLKLKQAASDAARGRDHDGVPWHVPRSPVSTTWPSGRRTKLLFVEDAGDKLHGQRNALDSGYVIDLTADYSKPDAMPVRFLAEGRDASATIDAGLSGLEDTGYQNEGDNEITGIHVSDGDASAGGLLGAKVPTPFDGGWRVFYTQQHGDNMTWELIRKPAADEDGKSVTSQLRGSRFDGPSPGHGGARGYVV